MERMASQSSDPAVLTAFTQTLRQRGGPASKNFFSAFRASFWSKNKWGEGGPPGPLP